MADPEDTPHAPVRIGDVERREVDRRLQQAVGDGQLTLGEYDERAALVWAARTRPDLEAVTRDLPSPAPPPAPVPAGRAPATRRVLAVMSADQLHGPLAPDQSVAAYAVMGEAVLDLRRADLPAETRVRATAVMGSVRVLVPRGTAVQLSGMSLMGGRELKVDPPRPGAPVVDLAGYAQMGAVEVTHGPDAPSGELDLRAHVPGGGQVASAAAGPVVSHGGSAGHSVGVSEPRQRPRRRLLIGVAALALVAAVGFQVTGQDSSAVFGSTVYPVPANRSSVDVGTMFGSVKVVVPDGAQVSTAGGVVFGSLECPSACDPRPAGGRAIAVHGAGGFGSIQVLTQSEAGAGDADDN